MPTSSRVSALGNGCMEGWFTGMFYVRLMNEQFDFEVQLEVNAE